MSAYFLPISDREALRWIVAEQRTAFPAHRSKEAAVLSRGDLVLLYTTRGCFGNPTRDRGRIIGEATVDSKSAPLESPVSFGGREYPIGVRFKVHRLAPMREGVELAPLVGFLATLPERRSWGVKMRRALVPVQPNDVKRLRHEVGQAALPYPDALDTYLK